MELPPVAVRRALVHDGGYDVEAEYDVSGDCAGWNAALHECRHSDILHGDSNGSAGKRRRGDDAEQCSEAHVALAFVVNILENVVASD